MKIRERLDLGLAPVNLAIYGVIFFRDFGEMRVFELQLLNRFDLLREFFCEFVWCMTHAYLLHYVLYICVVS